uniref:Uncharacterized protein n=1 Tax=Polytomella parva TaxID=51329 RepID=A0A7S0YKJ2_9CHLO|mmetsp:Transcript_33764/g.60954  ORF Transcript_33764/g.60954 Transcript_33764/m.60954 type:complete len:534 (+) Transcript_33764:335-1936(+)|eukprot:CAMPEP_0175079422 /NCGR_PEP_ID=MMETSP0052_2-20121109/24811_1 /TAXON_ID=51329 ORGANISM="Polytomella parva, Strain SAG 63-3" /NCGR_SAMPLE_ID=MMETSP0052_2 /ASSEMBLY_ACC=CAM_ASM_000194 /LENGTH=533 /DNA_ID=CAMNT_0016349745 /DNA_START=216 /DNA_END=1817 /DNA_ORIENTATION=+
MSELHDSRGNEEKDNDRTLHVSKVASDMEHQSQPSPHQPRHDNKNEGEEIKVACVLNSEPATEPHKNTTNITEDHSGDRCLHPKRGLHKTEEPSLKPKSEDPDRVQSSEGFDPKYSMKKAINSTNSKDIRHRKGSDPTRQDVKVDATLEQSGSSDKERKEGAHANKPSSEEPKVIKNKKKESSNSPSSSPSSLPSSLSLFNFSLILTLLIIFALMCDLRLSGEDAVLMRITDYLKNLFSSHTPGVSCSYLNDDATSLPSQSSMTTSHLLKNIADPDSESAYVFESLWRKFLPVSTSNKEKIKENRPSKPTLALVLCYNERHCSTVRFYLRKNTARFVNKRMYEKKGKVEFVNSGQKRMDGSGPISYALMSSSCMVPLPRNIIGFNWYAQEEDLSHGQDISMHHAITDAIKTHGTPIFILTDVGKLSEADVSLLVLATSDGGGLMDSNGNFVSTSSSLFLAVLHVKNQYRENQLTNFEELERFGKSELLRSLQEAYIAEKKSSFKGNNTRDIARFKESLMEPLRRRVDVVITAI